MTDTRHEEGVFRQAYADHYDLLYADKDYELECDFLEEVFRRYGKDEFRTVLDLGCGTGNHAFPLAKRGYIVTGVDHSEDMLIHARSKLAHVKHPSQPLPLFVHRDLRSLDLDRKFDAVLMMFAVLGYQRTNEDVLEALKTVRRHLKPGGLFLCDVWYGPAVLAIRPSDRVKIIPTGDGKIIRLASGALDIHHHLATVEYYILHLKDKAVLKEATETHDMRYFFPQELALFMELANLELIKIHTFMDLSRTPDDQTWNVLVLAQPQ